MKITTNSGITVDFSRFVENLHSDALAVNNGETVEYPIGTLDGCQIQVVVTRDDDRLLDPTPGYTCIYQ